jgi:hypothetical protein
MVARSTPELVREIPRILIALGAAIAPVGLVLFGMGVAFREPRDSTITAGIVIMVVGIGASLIGLGLNQIGFGGSDQVRVEPAQPAVPRQAVHPPSADAPRQATRPSETRRSSGTGSRSKKQR